MSSKAPEKDGDAQELDASHHQSSQEQPYVLLDLNGHLLRAFPRPEPTTSRATNNSGQQPHAQASMDAVPSNPSQHQPSSNADASGPDEYHTAPESSQHTNSSIANASESEPAPDQAFLPRRHLDYGRQEHAAVWGHATVPPSHLHSRGASNKSSLANPRYDRIEERLADLEGRIVRLEGEREDERQESRGKGHGESDRGHLQRRERQETSQPVPHRMTTPELERLTFPEDDLNPGEDSYEALVYQHPHYRHKSEIVGYRAAGRKKQTNPGTLGAVGVDTTRSPVGAGHGFSERDRDSATRFQHGAGSAREPHQERNAGTGQRLADQRGYGAERKRQDVGKGEEETSKDLAGSLHSNEA